MNLYEEANRYFEEILKEGSNKPVWIDDAMYSSNRKHLMMTPHGASGDFVIPDGVEIIDAHALFAKDITSVTIPDSVTKIGFEAFANCKRLTRVIFGKAPSLTFIGNGAFYSAGLESITVPASVTRVDLTAFDGCRRLGRIDVDPNNGNYSSQDGILYNKNKTRLLIAPSAIRGTLVVPASVTYIDEDAFGSTHLKRIELPDRIYRYFYEHGFDLHLPDDCEVVRQGNEEDKFQAIPPIYAKRDLEEETERIYRVRKKLREGSGGLGYQRPGYAYGVAGKALRDAGFSLPDGESPTTDQAVELRREALDILDKARSAIDHSNRTLRDSDDPFGEDSVKMNALLRVYEELRYEHDNRNPHIKRLMLFLQKLLDSPEVPFTPRSEKPSPASLTKSYYRAIRKFVKGKKRAADIVYGWLQDNGWLEDFEGSIEDFEDQLPEFVNDIIVREGDTDETRIVDAAVGWLGED